MKSNLYKSLTLLPAFVLLFVALLSSSLAWAQESQTKVETVDEDTINTKSTKKKTISIEEKNGVKVVTIVTEEKGKKTVQVLEGEEAEAFVAKEMERADFSMEDLELEMDHVNFDFDEGDIEKIIKIKSVKGGSEQDIEVFKEGNFDMNEMDVKVDDNRISISYTNENGKKVEKVIEVDSEELMNAMDNKVVIIKSIEVDDEENTEKRVVKRVMVSDTDMGNSNSEMLDNLEIDVDKSTSTVQIRVTPNGEGRVQISVMDMGGNQLFSDSYNGKGEYNKKIELGDHEGIVILKIEQGENVFVRKLYTQ